MATLSRATVELGGAPGSILACAVCGLLAAGCLQTDPPSFPDAETSVDTRRSDTPGPSDSMDAEEPDKSDDASDTEGDADTAPGPPEIVPTPRELVFAGPEDRERRGVEQGSSQTIELNLRNTGNSTTTVTGLSFDGDEDDEFTATPADASIPFDIKPGVFETIEVTYAPTDKDVARATLAANFAGPDGLEPLEIPLRTVNYYPDIDAPEWLRFGTVDSGDTKTREVVVYNRGEGDLVISDVSRNGSSDFSVDFSDSPGDEPDPNTALERGESMRFKVRFAPMKSERQTGSVVIESNDPDESSYTISLSANRTDAKCMEVQADPIEFEPFTEAESTREWGILNCNRSEPLEVEKVAFVTDGAGTFSIADPPEFPLEILGGEEEKFSIRAAFDEPGSAQGLLEVKSNDEGKSPLLIDVFAERTE